MVGSADNLYQEHVFPHFNNTNNGVLQSLRMTETTGRAVLSMINQFTDMISQEKSHLESVQSEIQSICNELLAMQRFLKDVDEESAGKHILELEKSIYDAEDLIVNYVLQTARSSRMKSLFERYGYGKFCGVQKDFVKDINRITGSIKELKSSFEGSSSHHSRGKSLYLGARLSKWLRSSVDFDEAAEDLSTVVGVRQQVMESLKAQLLSNENHTTVISILGVKGIGKTTLAWEIYKSRSVENDFHCKAWVCVSAMDNDLDEIVKDIDKQMHEFWQEKRYLIVIDDVRSTQIWSDLREKIVQPHRGHGSRIILTTRNIEVALSADYTHRLKVLSEEESWKLFMGKVFIAPWKPTNAGGNKDTTNTTEESPIPTSISTTTSTLPPELDALGKEMVGKCGGIPYFITELAKLLSTMHADPVEWSCVLHGTDTHLISPETTSDKHPWFNLSSSVDDILPLHVKHFLNLFPTAIEIPKRRMILSWAEGSLWHQSNSGNISGDKAAAMRMQWMLDLLDLNLIEAVKVSSIGIIKTYRIGPHLPLLQILKAGRANSRSSDDGNISSTTKVWIHQLADQYNSEDPHSCRIHSNINPAAELQPYKTLRSLWCFNYPQGYKAGHEVGSFLKRCIDNNGLWFLRVLDLEGVYKPSLPEAIGDLFNLRYLGLRWTYLDTLPSSVKNLQKLETLDTKHTDIGDYPTIQKMHKLQHLYLNERHHSDLVTQLSSLNKLYTLSGVIVDDFNQVKDGLSKLTNITELRMTCRLNDQQDQQQNHPKEAIAQWIDKLENLQTLKLTSKEQLDLWLDDHPKNKPYLSRMYLQGPWQVSDSGLLSFGSSLTALTLSLTKLHNDPMRLLGKLPELKLLRLFSESFIGNTMHCPLGYFEQLQVLKIWKLEKLEGWTMEDGAMPKLEELEIRSCNNLKMLPDHVPKTLRELKLTAMPKEFTSNVTGKDSEKVADVSSVLIEYWLDSIYTSAELYSGRNCIFQQRQLQKLFELEGYKGNLTELTLYQTKLEEDPMPVLEKLPQLTVLILSSKSFTGKHMVCSREGFEILRGLTIRELDELEEMTVEDGAMLKLEEMEIRSCKNLKELPQVLGTIKKLKLAKMPIEFTKKYKADKRVIIEDY